MQKTSPRLKRRKIKDAANRKSVPPALTLEQQMRLAAFDALMKWKDEQWAKMTPEEQRKELMSWKRVKQRINDDRAGYRKVFVDE